MTDPLAQQPPPPGERTDTAAGRTPQGGRPADEGSSLPKTAASETAATSDAPAPSDAPSPAVQSDGLNLANTSLNPDKSSDISISPANPASLNNGAVADDDETHIDVDDIDDEYDDYDDDSDGDDENDDAGEDGDDSKPASSSADGGGGGAPRADDARDAAPGGPDDAADRNKKLEPILSFEPGSEQALKSLLRQAMALPMQPGVYLMRDALGEIIYVGKAKALPKRVSSYFSSRRLSARIGLMVAKVLSFDFVVTGTEKEALLLENTLIKKHRPRFNVILRDDKTYPSLRLSLTDPFPRLEVVRRPLRDGSIIFGPFPSAASLKGTLKLVNKLFPLRKCARPDVKKTGRPCLNFQIGMCCGPCRPEHTKEEYGELTDQVRRFFQSERGAFIGSLENQMKDAARAYDFEKAAALRDRLADVRATLENQVVSLSDNVDMDVWGLASKDGCTQAAVIPLRSGVVSGCRPLGAEGAGDDVPETLASLMEQFYREGDLIPEEICLPRAPSADRLAFLREFLTGLRGSQVKIHAPREGRRLKLLQMAAENAQAAMEERVEHLTRTRGALAEIMARLSLKSIPRRLECFDLAHLQGEANVAGMVVMEDGEWKKAHYRKFKIREAKPGDDYGGMREAVGRRFRADRPGPPWPTPDLLLIDGGLGQLSAVMRAFADLELNPPPVAGIAKDRPEGGPDRIFIPGRKNPVDLKPGSAGLLLLSKLRDEAHRFCRGYHHDLRSKQMLTESLADVGGLGPKRLKALKSRYPTMGQLLEADDLEILKVVRLSKAQLLAVRARARELVEARRPNLGDPAPAAPAGPAPAGSAEPGSGKTEQIG
ncbi:MAG: excinuclease ABC subunit UvrC [Deltaproteobacteria bacterium]|nr:excinuclease ABC subunit UvrC [Deltaproteobacteria bacterium]